MTQEQIAERCANAAGVLISQGPAEPGPISSRYIVDLVNRAVRLGVDIGLDIADETALGQQIKKDTRFDHSLSEALNTGDGTYRP
jgi:hypothetical protein